MAPPLEVVNKLIQRFSLIATTKALQVCMHGQSLTDSAGLLGSFRTGRDRVSFSADRDALPRNEHHQKP